MALYNSLPRLSNNKRFLSCLLFYGPGNTGTDRPLAIEIVPIKAAKDENRPERYRIASFMLEFHNSGTFLIFEESCSSIFKLFSVSKCAKTAILSFVAFPFIKILTNFPLNIFIIKARKPSVIEAKC